MRGRQGAQRIFCSALMGLGFGVVVSASWALAREVRPRIRNAPSAPVFVQSSTIRMVQMYASPSQAGLPRDRITWSRMRDANHKELTPTQLFLNGETTLVNKSAQVVEVIALNVMPLDAFHQPIETSGQSYYKVHKIEERFLRGASQEVTWEQPVESDGVYEVAVSVVSVRFADGGVWTAPQDFVQETFFPVSGDFSRR